MTEMGFSNKLLFSRRKRNVAVTTSDVAMQTSDVKVDGAEIDRKKQEVNCNVTIETSSETRNNKHPGNNADKKKEEINMNYGAMKQFLKFKDRVIRNQKEYKK